MIAPSAAMVEMAQDRLSSEDYKSAHAWVWPEQVKQLNSAVPGGSEDFVRGYELGLETARVLLATMPEAVANKVEI